MTPRQMSVLKAIGDGNETPGMISIATERSSQDVSQILRRLEEMKCIEYRTNLSDRRSVLCSVTKVGKIALEQG
jgi:DNA-binding MarR family transcriptional regulator